MKGEAGTPVSLLKEEEASLSRKVELPRFLYAGLKKGEIVGRVDVYKRQASYPICTLIFNLGIAYLWQHSVTIWYVLITFFVGTLQAGILIWKHRSNIQRIRQGTEKKITIKKKS